MHFLTPVGRLDFATAPTLQREFDAIARDNATMIVVNLSRLTLLDPIGVDVLLEINEALGGDGGRLRVINGTRPIARVLEIAGMRDRLPIVSAGTPDPAPI